MTISKLFRVSISIAVLFALLAHPSPAKACSCGDSSPEDAIFTGKVIRMVDNQYSVVAFLNRMINVIGIKPSFFYIDGEVWGYSVFFRVDKSWKGVTETIVEIHTGYGVIESETGGILPDCGYPFVVGQTYLVYASMYANHLDEEPNNYAVNSMCAHTAEISDATEDLMYLNTLPTLPLTPTVQVPSLQIGTIFLLITTLIFTIIVISWRRHHHRAKDLAEH